MSSLPLPHGVRAAAGGPCTGSDTADNSIPVNGHRWRRAIKLARITRRAMVGANWTREREIGEEEGRRGCGYKFRLGMARAARCFKHICAAYAIIPLSVPVFLSLVPIPLSLFHAISLPVPPASSPSPILDVLSPSLFQSDHSIPALSPTLSRPLSLSLSRSISVAHTFIPPTGEHSPCQTRIDLTLSVADYKSDQLGARCACRIGIGERSEGANAGAALSLFENRYIPAQQPCTIAPCSPLLPAARGLILNAASARPRLWSENAAN